VETCVLATVCTANHPEHSAALSPLARIRRENERIQKQRFPQAKPGEIWA